MLQQQEQSINCILARSFSMHRHNNNDIKQKYIDYKYFDFIKHWSIKDKKFMASILFQIFKCYSTVEFDEKLQIAFIQILKRYEKLGTEFLPDNNISGTIRRYIIIHIKKEIQLQESYRIIQPDCKNEDEILEEICLEEFVLKHLNNELDKLEKNSKIDYLIEQFEPKQQNTCYQMKKHYIKKNKIKKAILNEYL